MTDLRFRIVPSTLVSGRSSFTWKPEHVLPGLSLEEFETLEAADAACAERNESAPVDGGRWVPAWRIDSRPMWAVMLPPEPPRPEPEPLEEQA